VKKKNKINRLSIDHLKFLFIIITATMRTKKKIENPKDIDVTAHSASSSIAHKTFFILSLKEPEFDA
jgi:hypothetical protein